MENVVYCHTLHQLQTKGNRIDLFDNLHWANETIVELGSGSDGA